MRNSNKFGQCVISKKVKLGFNKRGLEKSKSVSTYCFEEKGKRDNLKLEEEKEITIVVELRVVA